LILCPQTDSPARSTLGLAIGLQVAIAAGDGLAMIALAARTYQTSHISWAVAAIFLAISVPVTALAPVAGLLLDRFPARPVLVTAAVAAALVALALSALTGVAATLVLATGFGICAAVLQPGLGAIVPRLAGRVGVIRANGYLQAATWGGFTIGPLLAGLLTATGGYRTALIADAVLYALGAAGLWVLRLAPRPALDWVTIPASAQPPGPVRDQTTGPASAQPPGPVGDETTGPAPGEIPPSGQQALAAQLRAGFSYLRADTEAGTLVLTVGVLVGFANLAVVAEVVFAEHVLGSGPGGYSVLVAAWTAGMVIGTLLGGSLPRRMLLTAALAGTIATGAGLALAGAAVTLWQAAAAYGFGGLANGFEIVATRSFLNHRAPPAVSGRVFALYSGVLFGAASLGMAGAAGLLDPLGARGVLLLAGGGGILTGAIGSLIVLKRRSRPKIL
jgi:MFS family permease